MLVLPVRKINKREGQCEDMLAQLLPYPFGDLLVRGLYGTTLCVARNPECQALFPASAFPLGWMAKVRPVHPEVIVFPFVDFVVFVFCLFVRCVLFGCVRFPFR